MIALLCDQTLRINITAIYISMNNDNDNDNVILELNGNNKLFVGNVPYLCTQEEFEKCFEDVDGFKKAELITIYKCKNNVSRGFGFVTMETPIDADKLKRRDDIVFKGRTLRFTQYKNDIIKKLISKNINDIHDVAYNNYVYVEGIPRWKNRKWLRTCFSEYEPIGKYFVRMNHNTGEFENTGILEICDDSKYKLLLSKKKHVCDNITLDVSGYKLKRRDS